MTYTQAKMIIWNPEAYSRQQVREAAIWIISKLGASQEDLGQAYNLI